MAEKVERTDGRGILAGDYLNQNRTLTRQDWLEDCFPEWGTLLNKEIEEIELEKGTVAIWWLGGPSWVLKTDEGGIFFHRCILWAIPLYTILLLRSMQTGRSRDNQLDEA